MKTLIALTLFIFLFSCKEAETKKEEPAIVSYDTITPEEIQRAHDGTEGLRLEFKAEHTFEMYSVEVYKGKLADPDFTGNPLVGDAELVKLVKKACKEGVNFAGKYTLVHKDCGSMCEHIFVVDRTNGKVYDTQEPRDGKYGYHYKNNSRLLIANSEVFEDDTMTSYSDLYATPEVYVWESSDFKFLQ